MGDDRCAVRAVGQEEVPDANVVLNGPVLGLGVPIIEFSDQRNGLQTQSPSKLFHDCIRGEGMSTALLAEGQLSQYFHEKHESETTVKHVLLMLLEGVPWLRGPTPCTRCRSSPHAPRD